MGLSFNAGHGGCQVGSRRRQSLDIWLVLALATAAPAVAQVPVVLQGRVTTEDGASAVAGARVELQGHGLVETTGAGTFRFDRILPGSYSLRVTAVGYAPTLIPLTLRRDTTVAVRLAPVGYRLDSVVVRAQPVDVQGHVQDPIRDLSIPDAEVRSDQQHEATTNRRGRFRLRDAWQGTPLRISISAFGYLPIDTTVTPMEDARFVFDMVSDPVAERMIAHQIQRLTDRARGRLSLLMRPLNRDALLHAGGGSLRDILAAKYGVHFRRLQCVLLDDKPLHPSVDGPMMDAMSPLDIERVEMLFGGAMLRIYTRDFIKRMVSGSVVLRPPLYVGIARPPVCQ